MAKENETIQEQNTAADLPAETVKKKPNLRIIFGIALLAAVITVAVILIYHKIYYSNRWYKQTYINEVNVSGQTLEESKKTLEQNFSDYALTIIGRDNGELIIDGDDIDFSMSMHEEINTLFEQQHETFQIFSKKNEWTQKFNIAYDEDKLESIINSSELIAGSSSYSITAPKSASVTYSSSKQQYICKEEVLGNTLIVDNLLTAIKDTMKKGIYTLDLTDEEAYPDVYEAPEYTSESEEIQQELQLCNNSALRYIQWNMGKGNVEKITPVQISKWITYKNGKLKYNTKKIEAWVEKFCLKYKTVGITRKIKSHNGKTVKISGGDYGWQIDYEKTVKQTKKALKSAIDSDDTQAYINNPTDANKKKITLKRKVIYANTAYQKDYENFTNDWDPENYTEVSIKEQKVYVIRNGKVKFSCRCITGLPTKDRSTPTGAYFIKEHNLTRTLIGEDYATPVENWVRITWTGTGFHSASWQPWSSWTKTLYQTKGSHGCINLSASDSKKIYKLTNYREAVFIH